MIRKLDMKKIQVFILFIISITIAPNLVGQSTFGGMFNLNFGYGMEWPGGDMANRFGRNLKISIGAEQILSSKFYYGLDFDYKFNAQVKEDVFAPYRAENGVLYGSFGVPSETIIRGRGMFIGIYAGKIFSKNIEIPKGLKAGLGVGLLQHELIFNDDTQSFEIINGVYSKGYDRLSRGLAIKSHIGYMFVSKDKKLNMNFLVDYTLAFSHNVRKFNFDQAAFDTEGKIDHLIGLKFEILLPFYRYSEEEIIYY